MMFFFFNDTATTEIYTLSLHDALPIFRAGAGDDTPADLCPRSAVERSPWGGACSGCLADLRPDGARGDGRGDRKSTRLNSSHANISYAVFCLKKKKHNTRLTSRSAQMS